VLAEEQQQLQTQVNNPVKEYFKSEGIVLRFFLSHPLTDIEQSSKEYRMMK
jgi:hypothetical protein